jgi:hypothetical protein
MKQEARHAGESLLGGSAGKLTVVGHCCWTTSYYICHSQKTWELGNSNLPSEVAGRLPTSRNLAGLGT